MDLNQDRKSPVCDKIPGAAYHSGLVRAMSILNEVGNYLTVLTSLWPCTCHVHLE